MSEMNPLTYVFFGMDSSSFLLSPALDVAVISSRREAAASSPYMAGVSQDAIIAMDVVPRWSRPPLHR